MLQKKVTTGTQSRPGAHDPAVCCLTFAGQLEAVKRPHLELKGHTGNEAVWVQPQLGQWEERSWGAELSVHVRHGPGCLRYVNNVLLKSPR